VSLGCRTAGGASLDGSCGWSSDCRFRFLEVVSVGLRRVFWKVSQFCDGIKGLFMASCGFDMMGRWRYVDIRDNRWPIKRKISFAEALPEFWLFPVNVQNLRFIVWLPKICEKIILHG
jgi:hypothetical protein